MQKYSKIFFRHLAHVGWDQDGGFSRQVNDNEPLDDSVKQMLISLGQNPDSFNKDDVKFVYDFLQQKGFNPEDVMSNNLQGINNSFSGGSGYIQQR